MAKIISTNSPEILGAIHEEWRYNGLDCCVTLEVLTELLPQLDEISEPVYNHSLALQGPVLEMECRGILVDREEIQVRLRDLAVKLHHLEASLREILIEGLGLHDSEVSSMKKEKGEWVEKFMWNSPKQLVSFLYERLGLPRQRFKGQLTANRAALEKLKHNFQAQPILSHILAIRDISKKMGVLKSGIDPDNRFRFSLNIAGTDTFRLSSYESCFGGGSNVQNITEELRSIFIADPGMKIAYIDRAQIQSRIVGAICWNLFHDGTYLDFCESGDLHTGVCMMTWPEFDWMLEGLDALTDPIAYKHNRAIANQLFYHVDSYRQASKKLGHATNFMGKAQEISRQTAIPVGLVSAFQPRYYGGFPAIPEWHRWLRTKLIKDGWITTMCGQRRFFFGRRWEDETVKKAAAYEPQAVESFINQTGALQLWRAGLAGVQLLAPYHDAIGIQYPEEREDELIPQILKILEVPVPLMYGRTLNVPCDVQVGWNMGHTHNDKKVLVNPDGLVGYSGHDNRRRTKLPQPYRGDGRLFRRNKFA